LPLPPHEESGAAQILLMHGESSLPVPCEPRSSQVFKGLARIDRAIQAAHDPAPIANMKTALDSTTTSRKD